jgi:hypothetical protein
MKDRAHGFALPSACDSAFDGAFTAAFFVSGTGF